jgi:hypothetical protein
MNFGHFSCAHKPCAEVTTSLSQQGKIRTKPVKNCTTLGATREVQKICGRKVYYKSQIK